MAVGEGVGLAVTVGTGSDAAVGSGSLLGFFVGIGSVARAAFGSEGGNGVAVEVGTGFGASVTAGGATVCAAAAVPTRDATSGVSSRFCV